MWWWFRILTRAACCSPSPHLSSCSTCRIWSNGRKAEASIHLPWEWLKTWQRCKLQKFTLYHFELMSAQLRKIWKILGLSGQDAFRGKTFDVSKRLFFRDLRGVTTNLHDSMRKWSFLVTYAGSQLTFMTQHEKIMTSRDLCEDTTHFLYV